MLEAESRAWGEKNRIPFFATVEELNRAVDFFMILAPSNPETHLELCERVFPHRKPTYVDKTFAPDLRTARRIFDLADRFGVPMQTTSALRHTNVQRHVEEAGREKVRHMVTWGGGSSFGEYAIHPLELAISCMGPEVERMMVRGDDPNRQLLLDFSRGRSAVVNVYTKARTPYAAAVTTTEATHLLPVESGQIFLNTAAAILDLFEKGRPDIDRNETLAIRRILDMADDPGARAGFVPLADRA
jgi:predicted dehydrogenase